MRGFILKSASGLTIRFHYYDKEAPITVQSFSKRLPFERHFCHAKVSGQEIWTDQGLDIDVIQENASIYTLPGEMVLGPISPGRTRTSNCLGVYYGEGKGFDACNIFAKVVDEDASILLKLGEEIWKQGQQLIRFEILVELP